MQLKITPRVSPRYWTALLIASTCGTNLGDFLPDFLKVSTRVGLLLLIGLFTVIVLAERMTRHGSEAFYWLSISVVRAAATNIADFAIEQQHLGYPPWRRPWLRFRRVSSWCGASRGPNHRRGVSPLSFPKLP